MTNAAPSPGTTPEPSAPALRASDAERERVAEALRQAAAEGRLDMPEFEQRLDAAYQARTHADLEALLRDLPVPAATVSGAADTAWAGRIGGPPTSGSALAFLAGFQRKGPWTVPRRFKATAFWGGGEIDLREARFEDREVVIRCVAVMGGLSVIVPPELEVRITGTGIMGGFDQSAAGAGAPGAPTVVISGFAFWGGVSTERRRTREDRKRVRAERRELKAQRRR
ncbi:DUF1707 domain-containing protein [Streptomyces sp. B1866]|uniref:DUF1707 SHOCT-like domain-containing protein n=1 Tax=Streptomyces sp. B1866 TaxID=3075431 RepID=UPI00288EF172|nr:DUF1707 domain-containing protein [Streptomyces sp. B1866]MDT3396609.1 DUF1707 domain-containing protein [Streptomyces sp. B1866]